MINWQLLQKGIRWPVSHDRIAGLSVELTEVTCFFLLIYRWPCYGFSFDRKLKYFHKILKQAKPGLARSIYYCQFSVLMIITATFSQTGFSLNFLWSCNVFFLCFRALRWSIGWPIRVLYISLLSSQLFQQRLLFLDNHCSTWICTKDRLCPLRNRKIVSEKVQFNKTRVFTFDVFHLPHTKRKQTNK